MKITTKHRIAYKHKGAPGEPVEMAIWRREEGDFVTSTGDLVANRVGEPVHWVNDLIGNHHTQFVGHIIPPPLEPYVGMVVENPEDASSHVVCYWVSVSGDDSTWVSDLGVFFDQPDVLELVKDDGWRVREVGA